MVLHKMGKARPKKPQVPVFKIRFETEFEWDQPLALDAVIDLLKLMADRKFSMGKGLDPADFGPKGPPKVTMAYWYVNYWWDQEHRDFEDEVKTIPDEEVKRLFSAVWPATMPHEEAAEFVEYWKSGRDRDNLSLSDKQIASIEKWATRVLYERGLVSWAQYKLELEKEKAELVADKASRKGERIRDALDLLAEAGYDLSSIKLDPPKTEQPAKVAAKKPAKASSDEAAWKQVPKANASHRHKWTNVQDHMDNITGRRCACGAQEWF